MGQKTEKLSDSSGLREETDHPIPTKQRKSDSWSVAGLGKQGKDRQQAEAEG